MRSMGHRPSPVLARLLVLAMLAVACTPQAVMPSPSGGGAVSAGPSGTAAASPSARPTFTRPTPTPLPTFLVHIVAPGETLTAIARRYGTSVFSLSVWNRARYPTLDPLSEAYAPDRVQVGWRLELIPNAEADEEDLLPSAAPSTAPSPTTAPSGSAGPDETAVPSVGGAARIVRNGPRTTATVALTFDMGGRLDPAQDILAWLLANGVPATIFPTGRTGTTTAEGIAALEVMAANRTLLDLGNHSWSHPDFRDLDAAAMQDQLIRTEDSVSELTDRSTKPWFRPPYGGLDDQVPAVVGAAGWSTIVMWDVDTIDWRPIEDGGPTAAEMVDKVVAGAQGGSIILLHLGGYETLEALPTMLAGLRAKGLEPVTLDTMFGG
jgi:peptidoglycan/xylan/chitin deacetylase (PgdA/CDA1 family)